MSLPYLNIFLFLPLPLTICANGLEKSTLATGSKVLEKVLAFGSSFALCRAHRDVTVKQSPLVSDNSHISLWHNPSTALAHISPSLLMADLQKVSFITHIHLLNLFCAPFIFWRMRKHFYHPFPFPAALDYNYLLSKHVCSEILEAQRSLFQRPFASGKYQMLVVVPTFIIWSFPCSWFIWSIHHAALKKSMWLIDWLFSGTVESVL